jgi:flagellar L-ring protein precursor FlgH
MKRSSRAVSAALLMLGLAGCDTLQRLSEVGRPPALAPTEDPTRTPGWRPVTMPMPAPQPAPAEGESLWRSGSRAFFKDQRAARVGDLVTVLVTMNDQATLKNATTATRNSAEAAGIPNLFGLETLLAHVPMDPSKLISMSSSNSAIGAGQVQRSETVTLRLAGVVTQVLPNGNLVVMAHQQFRADAELRDLKVSGVIRPEDIASDNTIKSDRMAEARIAYGGRGELTDVQTPRWGQQAADILLPF